MITKIDSKIGSHGFRGVVVSRCLVGVAGILLAACANSGPQGQVFETAEQASAALVDAAEQFDVEALSRILGPDGIDLVVTEDPVLDREQGLAFAAQARESLRVDPDPADPDVAIMIVGPEEWPLPIPIIREGGGWRFDTAAGREEVLLRRIGNNELDAITLCEGYVEAQHEYALQRHPGMTVNQYAQRIVSTPGTRDGLSWVDEDGEWRGPIGEEIAEAIEQGYGANKPYHGYFYKVLKGQGPDAPLGELDYVIDGAMIGGFALVAAPASYEITGIMTFIVSNDGVVYQKDLGPTTLEQFQAMERFNPDSTWEPVLDDEE